MISKSPIPDDVFIKAIENAVTVRNALELMGSAISGNSYAIFWRRVERLNINTDHLNVRHWRSDRKPNPSRPVSYYLQFEGPVVQSTLLKKRLIKEGLLNEKCYKCGVIEWCGDRLTLHLDHIDGYKFNNQLENLRLLCPNCHSQTDTYAGKNYKHYDKNKIIRAMKASDAWDRSKILKISPAVKPVKTCVTCAKEISKKAKRCSSCAAKNRGR
jgi:hypothetical protein